MKLNHLAVFVIFITISSQFAFSGDAQFEELKKLILEMQTQLGSQQNEINALRQQLQHQNETIAAKKQAETVIENRLDSLDEKLVEFDDSYSVIKDTPIVKLGKKIDSLAIKGDARFRYERQERTRGVRKEETRDRQRVRLRIGGTWNNEEDNWELGVGVVTGGSGATSANDTFSDTSVFETGDLRLDYAYFKHSRENSKLIIGQQKNPFTTTFILWDSDVRPIGLTAAFDIGGAFITTGLYDMFHIGRDEANAFLFGSQVGYKVTSEHTEFVVAGGYYYFNDATSNSNFDVTTIGASNLTGTNPPPGIAPGIDKKFDFRVGDVYSHVKMRVGDLKFKLFGHLASNFGADGTVGHTGITDDIGRALDPDKNDMAWALGFSSEVGALKIGYTFASIEADSIYQEIKDSDFGDTAGLTDTDVKGHKISLKYKLKDTISLGGTYMDLEEINGSHREGELVQLDLIYKF